MSETSSTAADRPPTAPSAEQCGWVKLHHASGVLVTVPVSLKATELSDYKAMFANVGKMIEAGFRVNAPGLEAGEERKEVGYVVRSIKSDSRSGPADVLFLYATDPAWTRPFLAMYLNDDSDRNWFEKASGMQLSKIPEYIGTGRLERGKGSPQAQALIVPAPRPFGVVYGPNPKWDAAKAAASTPAAPYMVAKNKFIRWEGCERPGKGTHNSGSAPATRAVTDQMIQDEWAWWRKMFSINPPVDVFNRNARERWEMVPEIMQIELKRAINTHAKSCGWQWDNENGEFMGSPESGGDIPF